MPGYALEFATACSRVVENVKPGLQDKGQPSTHDLCITTSSGNIAGGDNRILTVRSSVAASSSFVGLELGVCLVKQPEVFS